MAPVGDCNTNAETMCSWHQKFPFEFVLMLGDNLYGHEKPSDFVRKFE